MENDKRVRLFVDSAVRKELEQRRLSDEEIQRTISLSEKTGKKFVHPVTGHFLAGARQDKVTIWVEYAPREDGFDIYKAYQYRLEVFAWDLKTGNTRGD
ncbi:hypothetical protein DSCO28_62980 [Desulfosarcina ovata subsp. sediminis]|uniref:DUF4258 domain-containing protein n=1 Tax=Desulfosarcina ovata subsp. sediminis TaxID=885957 RepID=A0A5K7ZZQ2_9BACT|nr:hypothetical protein [Desulfosarcina ovata]BBO85732.1 hypothetical protein DSCO28_62980 [Desulfosarcina ovata subsp. sediminis]